MLLVNIVLFFYVIGKLLDSTKLLVPRAGLATARLPWRQRTVVVRFTVVAPPTEGGDGAAARRQGLKLKVTTVQVCQSEGSKQ